MPTRPKEVSLPTATQAGPVCKWLKPYPTVASYLLDLQYSDDPTVSREPSTMFLKYQGGDLMCWFGDPSTEAQVRIVVPSLSELFPALELALSSANCPWQHRPADRGRASQKKPKK